MDAPSITAYISIALSVGATLFAILNHTRIRSRCCSRLCEMSVDVDKTTPTSTIPSSIGVPK